MALEHSPEEKFLLQENVPVMTGRLQRSRETEYSAQKPKQQEKAGAAGHGVFCRMFHEICFILDEFNVSTCHQ